MPVATSTELNPGLVPIVGARVIVRLITSPDNPWAPGYVPSDDFTIAGQWETITDNAGVWSTPDVPSTNDVVPANSVYIADVIPPNRHGYRHVFLVPAGAGPHRVEDNLADPPADMPTLLSTALATETAARTSADAIETAARLAGDAALGWVNDAFLYVAAGTSHADIQSKVTLAQTTGKPLYFGAGAFNLAGVTTAQSFNQPNIYGLGMRYTTVTCSTSSAAFTFVGGSGQMNGGSLNNMTISGAGATGVTILGANGILISRVRFASLARGVLFSNNAASGTFSEFNVARDCVFESTCVLHIEYEKGTGSISFHGSGFDGNCVFVQSAATTGPIVKIGAGCLLYDAPWGGTFFLQSTQPPVLNSSVNPATVYGFIRVEMQGGHTATFVNPTSAAPVYSTGQVQTLTETVSFYPLFRLAERAQYNSDSSVTLELKPYSVKKALAAGTTVLLASMQPGKAATVSVTVRGPNHEYGLLVAFYSHPTILGASVAPLATMYAFDAAAIGAPVLSVNASGELTIVHAGYSSSFTAWVGVQELGTWVTHPTV